MLPPVLQALLNLPAYLIGVGILFWCFQVRLREQYAVQHACSLGFGQPLRTRSACSDCAGARQAQPALWPCGTRFVPRAHPPQGAALTGFLKWWRLSGPRSDVRAA